jgi:hypothetical protein
MRKMSLTLATVVALLVGGGVVGAAGGAALAAGDTQPPPDTVVAVRGDAETGFAIRYQDGSALFPPTTAEALAACGEHDSRVRRVRCRTAALTWYRDLGDLQQALRWARAS